MPIDLPPGLLLIAGGLLSPLLGPRLRLPFLLALVLLSLVAMLALPADRILRLDALGHALQPVRADAMARLFGMAFHAALLLGLLYAASARDALQDAAATCYAGASIGAVFAGDLVTLLVYWELTAVTSVLLIWAQRTAAAMAIGLRYLLYQVGSGVALLTGIVVLAGSGHDLAFDALDAGSSGGLLILLAFGLKAAFPLLHGWLPSAYPAATIAGTVFLSAFTTKMAIYALARGFAGYAPLVWVGVAMALGAMIYAAAEREPRRLLTYSLQSQLGLMVAAIGIGGAIAVNGAFAHAATGILYIQLLFMAVGAVEARRPAPSAGGQARTLARSMPFTLACALVGAATIAGVPGLAAYASKTMLLSGVAEAHQPLVWLLLMVAVAGTVYHTGLRLPWLTFFAPGRATAGGEAPATMRIAMALAALGCILPGVAPDLLYRLLPQGPQHGPFDAGHLIGQAELLLWSALAFMLLLRLRPTWIAGTRGLADVDALYVALVAALLRAFRCVHASIEGLIGWLLVVPVQVLLRDLRQMGRDDGPLTRVWPTGTILLSVALLLLAYLVLSYLPLLRL